ncbi:MAG: class I SAM-dependent methyltransferase [Rhodospirillaceae bacterium]
MSILAESLIIQGVYLPPHLAHLPPPPPEARAVSAELAALIAGDIRAHGGWVSFARYMELALYAPGLGYYSAGSRKFGAGGDFVTAPELTSLFGRCIARQVAQLRERALPDVLEVGAGSGALAADVLRELGACGQLPERYLILEVSADLRERQRATIAERAAQYLERVQWLEVLPSRLNAVVIGNEVLDAIPTHVVRVRNGTVSEVGVAAAEGPVFSWSDRRAEGDVLAAATALALPEGYRTELNIAARGFIASFARLLERGVMLLIDYGYPAREFYHPARAEGTLMCHYRHHAHGDPFVLVGLQDITAHVDFTAIAEAAVSAGAEVLGYTTQANFLINCGITEMLAQVPASDVHAYAPLASQAQQLLSPTEMGDRFKVIALGKGIQDGLRGFAQGDKTHLL